jgi:hypothetical protein
MITTMGKKAETREEKNLKVIKVCKTRFEMKITGSSFQSSQNNKAKQSKAINFLSYQLAV